MTPWIARIGVPVFAILVGVSGTVPLQTHSKQNVASNDSPVTVRGGSMTIRTANGWVSAGGYYCAYIPIGNPLNLYLTDRVDSYPHKTPFPSTKVPLTGSWSVTINGRSPKYVPPTPTSTGYWDSTMPSNNGIILEGANNNCPTALPTQSLVVLTTTGTYSSFYLPDLGLHEGSPIETGKRFMDTTPGSGPTPSICAGPNSNSTPTGNEDSCERASLITATTSFGGPYYGWCRDGECIVGIGQ